MNSGKEQKCDKTKGKLSPPQRAAPKRAADSFLHTKPSKLIAAFHVESSEKRNTPSAALTQKGTSVSLVESVSCRLHRGSESAG